MAYSVVELPSFREPVALEMEFYLSHQNTQLVLRAFQGATSLKFWVRDPLK